MRIVALSDTHGFHKFLNVPDGDVLVHAGDFSMAASYRDVVEFTEWLDDLPHKHKIVVPGNHDIYVHGAITLCEELFRPVHLLIDRAVTLDGIEFFGSPWTPSIFEPSRWVFDYPKGSNRARRIWKNVPFTNVLITHGPPQGILDEIPKEDCHPGETPNVGDPFLREYVETFGPMVHIFGHIHEGHGSVKSGDLGQFHTDFYNVCICDGAYKPINPITVIDL